MIRSFSARILRACRATGPALGGQVQIMRISLKRNDIQGLFQPFDLLACRLGSPPHKAGHAGKAAVVHSRDKPPPQVHREILHLAYPILYSAGGRVAHECILDTRVMKDRAGVTVDDVAKRLVDCGFHAPTMSWPVAGTLMVEPTESEPKAELDRFITAMLGIAAEVEAIVDGKLDAEDNPLKRAPHTVEDLVGDWNRPYSRESACFPPGAFRVDKYWSSVNRVDNVYGDRHLICSCPPLETYAEAAE